MLGSSPHFVPLPLPLLLDPDEKHCDKDLAVKTHSTAPDFTLEDRNGTAYTLSDIARDGKPVFVEFGSFT